MALYFEDFTPGRAFTTPACSLSEAQIMDFAFTYDPQPFHLDKTLPDNPFGGLIAPTTACMWRPRLWSSAPRRRSRIVGPW